jgi:hypothetical protein
MLLAMTSVGTNKKANPLWGLAFFMIGSGGALAKIVGLYAEPFPLVSNGY